MGAVESSSRYLTLNERDLETSEIIVCVKFFSRKYILIFRLRSSVLTRIYVIGRQKVQ